LGGIVSSAVALRLQNTDWWAFVDNGTPGLAIGLGITRIGCYLFGCDYGVRSTDALAVSFPRWDDTAVGPWMPASSPAHSDHVVAGLDFASAHSHLVHPTQLYESLVGFLAFAVLILWRPKKRFHGQICLAFLIYYAIARFAIELLRGDADRGDSVMLGMSTSQLIGFLMLGGLLVLWFRQAARGLYAARGTRFSAPASSSPST
jgi:phosphatidylglycerol:prolipoprotein diacylglycerol transferase